MNFGILIFFYPFFFFFFFGKRVGVVFLKKIKVVSLGDANEI